MATLNWRGIWKFHKRKTLEKLTNTIFKWEEQVRTLRLWKKTIKTILEEETYISFISSNFYIFIYISNFLETRNEDSFGNDRGNDEASAPLARHWRSEQSGTWLCKLYKLCKTTKKYISNFLGLRNDFSLSQNLTHLKDVLAKMS